MYTPTDSIVISTPSNCVCLDQDHQLPSTSVLLLLSTPPLHHRILCPTNTAYTQLQNLHQLSQQYNLQLPLQIASAGAAVLQDRGKLLCECLTSFNRLCLDPSKQTLALVFLRQIASVVCRSLSKGIGYPRGRFIAIEKRCARLNWSRHSQRPTVRQQNFAEAFSGFE